MGEIRVESIIVAILGPPLATIMMAALSTCASVVRRMLDPSVEWLSTNPRSIRVVESGAEMSHRGNAVHTLAQFTCTVQYTRIGKRRMPVRGSFDWEAPGAIIGLRILAKYRCSGLTLTYQDDRLSVTFNEMQPGSRAIVRILCNVNWGGIGQVANPSEQISVRQRNVNLPRWGITLTTVVAAILLAQGAYYLIYSVLSEGLSKLELTARLADPVSVFLMVAIPATVVLINFRRFSIAYWLGYGWLVFRDAGLRDRVGPWR